MPDSTVLLVDDDAVFAAVTARVLSRRNFRVLVAHDQAQALDLAHHHPITHAIVDLRLGSDSGLTLLSPLRTLLPEAIIVVLTSYASIPTTVEAIKRGADNYLTKPLDTATLLTALDHPSGTSPPVAEKPISLRRLEWEHIQRVLDEHDGNITQAAQALGLHRRTLQRKLAKKPVQQ